MPFFVTTPAARNCASSARCAPSVLSLVFWILPCSAVVRKSYLPPACLSSAMRASTYSCSVLSTPRVSVPHAIVGTLYDRLFLFVSFTVLPSTVM